RWPSNCTSTTAPMTWVIFPTALVGVAIVSPCYLQTCGIGASRSQCLRAGDDLDQLLGDHGLAGAVVGQRLLADHLAGIAGGVIHRAHLRAVERGGVFQERAEQLDRDIARQELVKDFLLLGLVLVDRAAIAVCGL